MIKMKYELRFKSSVRKAYELLMKVEQQCVSDDELKQIAHECRKHFEKNMYDRVFE